MTSNGEPGKIEKRMVVEYGITLDGIWLPLAMLRRLRAHGPWDAPFTEANADQEQVLLMHGLAERHNQVGLHRGTGLTGFLDAIPYEPTVAFPSFPPRGPTASTGDKSRQEAGEGNALALRAHQSACDLLDGFIDHDDPTGPSSRPSVPCCR